MKKRSIRLAALVLAVGILLAGCGRYSPEIGDLIVPPEPSGDLALIREALYDFAGQEITLRYPKSGEYRSAFVVYDINGDSQNEVCAFYSTVSEENTTVMHLNLIARRDGAWRSVNDFSFDCSGAEWVRFTDLTGDGTPEVVVSWTVSASPIKKLTVFRYQRSELIPYLNENYSTYAVCDLDDKGPELLLVTVDPAAKQATAKLLTLSPMAADTAGLCRMDGTVLSYYTPIFSALPDGRPAVYLDADKGTEGTVTEILYCEEGRLTDPFVGENDPINTATLRASTTRCSDFDGDGIPEIPLITALPSPQTPDGGETVYRTDWVNWNGNGFDTAATALMNYTDGYYFELDPSLRDGIAATRNAETGERVLYRYEPDAAQPFTELFRLRTLPTEEWKAGGGPSNYAEIASNDTVTVAALLRKNESGIDRDYLEKHIKFIESGENR